MNIINLFKTIFYNSNLEFLNERDIILANRYNTEEEKNEIEEGHRNGPYIIIRKSGKKVYGLECGSNRNTKSLQILKLDLNRKYGYNLNKDGYIYLGKLVLLNKKRFLNKIGKIDEEDLNRIYKSIYLIKKNYKNINLKNIPIKKLKFYFDKGDIILYKNKMFYINEKDNKYFYCNQIHESKKGKITIKINNISYSINFASSTKIERKNNFELLNVTDESTQKNIQLLIDKLNKKSTCKVLNRGKLIEYNKKFYYVYGEYKDKLLVFRVYIDKQYKVGMKKIIISKGIYYTYFEETEINRNADIKIIREAKELEMHDIKNMKKHIKEEIKTKVRKYKILYKKYQPGYIITNLKTLDRYVIISRNKNTITFAKINNLNKLTRFTFKNNCKFDFNIAEKMEKYTFQTILDNYQSNLNKEEVEIVNI